MIDRIALSTVDVPHIEELLQEGLHEVVANLEDRAYPSDKPREVVLRVVVTPMKDDPNHLYVDIYKQVKVPKRLGKPLHGVLKNGSILVDIAAQDQDLFDSKVIVMQKEKAE